MTQRPKHCPLAPLQVARWSTPLIFRILHRAGPQPGALSRAPLLPGWFCGEGSMLRCLRLASARCRSLCTASSPPGARAGDAAAHGSDAAAAKWTAAVTRRRQLLAACSLAALAAGLHQRDALGTALRDAADVASCAAVAASVVAAASAESDVTPQSPQAQPRRWRAAPERLLAALLADLAQVERRRAQLASSPRVVDWRGAAGGGAPLLVLPLSPLRPGCCAPPRQAAPAPATPRPPRVRCCSAAARPASGRGARRRRRGPPHRTRRCAPAARPPC